MFNKITGELFMLGLRHSLNTLAAVDPERAGHIAFELLSIPRSGKIPPERAAILNTAKHQDLELAGFRIRSYRWKGAGPRVLLLHGWESDAGRWKPLIERLRSSGFDVMAIDAPAHGNSSGRQFTAVLYAYVIGDLLPLFEPEVIVGHSAGGMAVMYQFNRQKEYLPDRLVLMGTPSELTDLAAVYRSYVGLNDRVIKGMDLAFEKKYHHPVEEFSIRNFAKKLDMPGLIIHDRQDDIAPYSGAIEVHRNWRGSRMLSTDGLGHSLNGLEVEERIIAFLK